MRRFPATSPTIVLQVLSDVQVTEAAVVAPFSSCKARGCALAAPTALFQFAFAITPATSVGCMAVPSPTKSMLIAVVGRVVFETVNCTAKVCTAAPLAPVMVSGYTPTDVAAEVLICRVTDPDPATVAGLKLAVAPFGRPITLSVTDPEKTFSALTLSG